MAYGISFNSEFEIYKTYLNMLPRLNSVEFSLVKRIESVHSVGAHADIFETDHCHKCDSAHL